MSWTAELNDFNIGVWVCLSWRNGGELLRSRRDRRELAQAERDRWARLAPSPLAADLATRLAQEYLRGTDVLSREECDAVAAYIVADVSARWPPALDDLRHIAVAIGEPGALDYLKSLVPGGPAEQPSRRRPRWWPRGHRDRNEGTPPAITDGTASAVTLRLLFTFTPPGQDRGEYLSEVSQFAGRSGRLPVDRLLPALLLRRGLNDRSALKDAS